MRLFLAPSDVIDWVHPDIRALASRLANSESDHRRIARRCFEWVRDKVEHSVDFGRAEVTCKASEVLAHRTGFCYAKSHLLAALLRANGVPAAFCYQRLSVDGTGPPFCLHGLNAVWLPEFGWYRVDARGNKAGVTAEFTPPIERLAFSVRVPGEADLLAILPEPLPDVVQALRQYEEAHVLAANLPDQAPVAAGI
ncbi:MAG TPA: transglutaminase family protein [Pirellulales bacterium]|nr:transglutaminase family protein [Pirellulales bacterium]